VTHYTSDVGEERKQAEEVVAYVNTLVGPRFGWHIELNKWENRVPGYGRPQALINPLVDECDIFIGLLWERWGQPSGMHSSGFEEEFERAKNRRKSSGVPDIWLVFKEVASEKLKDPGDQLKRVLEFRKSEEALQEVLFKSVRDLDDWKIKLQTWFFEHIFERAQLPPVSPQPASTVPPFESPSLLPHTSGESRAELAANRQLKRLVALLGQALEGGAVEFSAGVDSPLREFDVARLFLLSATLSSRRYTREVLGTHEVNLLYKYREQLETAPEEDIELIRATIGDISDVKPGWFWFRVMEEEIVPEFLFSFVIEDGSDEVRAGALNLLTAGGINIPEDWWQLLPLHHTSSRVRFDAFNYLISRASVVRHADRRLLRAV
jgi:Domain of unknown function (DUF4062)